MLYCNYNILTLPMKTKDKYKVGDIYKSISKNWREQKFNGLEIKNIDYVFGVRLHFDFYEWENKKV